MGREVNFLVAYCVKPVVHTLTISKIHRNTEGKEITLWVNTAVPIAVTLKRKRTLAGHGISTSRSL